METTSILSIVFGGLMALFGGLNIFQFFFLRSTKKTYEAAAKKSQAEAEKAKQEAQGVANQNESAAVQTLKDAIEFMSKINKDAEGDKMLLSNKVDELNKIIQVKDEKIASLLTMICKHMGCGAREPLPGQGRVWFDNNQDNLSLGIDYLPINQLMKRYGAKNRQAMENQEKQNDDETHK